MRLPSSLTSRLVLTTVGLVALVSVLVSVVTTLAVRELLSEQLDDAVLASAGRAQSPGDGRDGRDGPGGRDDPDPVEGSLPDEIALLRCTQPPPGQGEGTLTACFGLTGSPLGTVIDRRGSADILDTEAFAALEGLDERGRDGLRSVEVPGLGGYRVVVDEVGLASGGSVTIVTGLPTDDIDETVANLVRVELLLGLVGIVLAYGAGRLLVRRTLRPLRDVAAVAHEVTLLDLDQGEVGRTVRVPEQLTDETTEVGQVGASLNSLLTHVEEALDARHRSEQQVRQFVADASHELRTPLTTIRGYAELAGRKPELMPTSIAKVSEEAQRMTALVEDLLLLARLDSGRPLERKPVDLTALVISAVDDARVVGTEHTWSLDLPDEPVTVVGDEQRLHQVVTNLLTNARRHTPPGTVVTTMIRRRGDRVLLTVQDDGPGVPEGLDVFDRFTRGDSSRTRASGGAGLGLSLVAAIVAAHAGTVGVVSSPGNTAFTVDLPG